MKVQNKYVLYWVAKEADTLRLNKIGEFSSQSQARQAMIQIETELKDAGITGTSDYRIQKVYQVTI